MRYSYNLSTEIPELFTNLATATSKYFTVSEYSTKSNDNYKKHC